MVILKIQQIKKRVGRKTYGALNKRMLDIKIMFNHGEFVFYTSNYCNASIVQNYKCNMGYCCERNQIKKLPY